MSSTYFSIKYYIYQNGKKLGPFTLSEIEENHIPIDSDTLVWTKGMENWEKAEKINDFEKIISNNLPPEIPTIDSDSINDTPPPPPTDFIEQAKQENDRKEPNQEFQFQQPADSKNTTSSSNFSKKTTPNQTKSSGPNRSNSTKIYLIGLLGLTIIAISIWVWNENSVNKKQQELLQLQQENQTAELKRQQEIIEEHKKVIEAQQLAERQSKIEQLREVLFNLNTELEESKVYLESERIKLNDIKQFQLLRTSYEKEKQIRNQLSIIQGWEAEINRLKSEIKRVQSQIQQLEIQAP